MLAAGVWGDVLASDKLHFKALLAAGVWGDVLASDKLHFKALLAAGVAGRCVGEEAAHQTVWQVNSDNERPKDSPKKKILKDMGHDLPTTAIMEIGDWWQTSFELATATRKTLAKEGGLQTRK